MFTKSVSILFLSLACLLNLGHSFFPHTHLNEHHHAGKQHHHYKDNSDQNGIAKFFSHLNHNSDSFSNCQLGAVVKNSKEVLIQVFVFRSTFVLANSIEYCYKKEVFRNKEPLIFISPHLHSLQFRGPPTSLI